MHLFVKAHKTYNSSAEDGNDTANYMGKKIMGCIGETEQKIYKGLNYSI